MDLNQHVQKNKNGEVIVTGGPITIMIPRSYEKYKRLNITDEIDTLAIFEMSIGNETKEFFLPATVVMRPSLVEYVTNEGQDYVRAVFEKGDIFIKNTNVVKNAYIAYIIFSEYIEKGQIPRYLTYNQLAYIFDTVQKITGCKLPAEHAVFEMIYAHLSRDQKKLSVPYRLTPMSESPKFLKLKDVPHAATSTTAKLIGSYLNDSLVNSMVNAAEDESDVEDLLRH